MSSSDLCVGDILEIHIFSQDIRLTIIEITKDKQVIAKLPSEFVSWIYDSHRRVIGITKE